MPAFLINHTHHEGHFNLTFTPGINTKFYGIQLKELDAFRCYGVLPDNDIAVNKLINAIGQNLLYIEEKKSKLNLNQDALNKDILFYASLEALSNAMTINILTAIAPLEQLRNSLPTSSKQISDTLSKIEKVYDNYLEQLNILGGYQNPIHKQRVNQLASKVRLQKNKWQKLSLLNIDTLSNEALRNYYQEILNDFNAIQRDITIYQRPYLGSAEFANQSATQAYQRASYELESHLFSEDIPSDKQLWIIDDSLKIGISTKEMPTMRKDLALKAGLVVGIKDESPSTNNLSEQYLIFKEKIKQANLEDKQKKTETPEEVTARKSINTIEELNDSLLSLISDTHEEVLTEQRVQTHPCSDIFSSLGACYSLLKTLECEIAAKHPVVSTGVFLTSALTFTATGLASIGIAESSMKHLLLVISKCLTLNGHIGISVAEMQLAIETLNKLVLSQQHGFLLEVIIKNGFVLPTALATAADLFANGLEDKDILTTLYRETFADELEGKTTATFVQEIMLKLFLTGLAISTAYGLEIGLVMLNQIIGTTTQANLLIGVLTLKEFGYYRSAVDQMLTTLYSIIELKKSGGINFQNNNRILNQEKETLDAIGIIMGLGHLYKNSPATFQAFIAQYELSVEIKNRAINEIKFLEKEFKSSPEFLKQLGLPYQAKTGFLGWVGRGIVGGLLGLLIAASIIIPIGMILATLFSPRFDTWLAKVTARYQGSFFKDVGNIALSGGKYIAGLLVAVFTLIPVLLVPPLMFSSWYKRVIFNDLQVQKEDKNRSTYIQNIPLLIVKNGVMGAAKFITTGMVKKLFYPLFGLIFILLSAAPMMLNLLFSTLSGLISKPINGSFSKVFHLVMTPTYKFIHSESVSEGLKIPILAIPRMFMFVLLPIKMIVMSVSEFIRRIPMMLIDDLFNLSLIANALFTRNDKKIGLKAMASHVSKLIYYPLMYLPLYLGAQFKAVALGLIHGPRGKYGFFDNFKTMRKQSLKNSWITQIKEFYQMTSLNLLSVTGAGSIIRIRDYTLSSLSAGYFAVKEFLGKGLTKVRNFFMRQPEDMFQKDAIRFSQSPMQALHTQDIEMLTIPNENLLAAPLACATPLCQNETMACGKML